MYRRTTFIATGCLMGLIGIGLARKAAFPSLALIVAVAILLMVCRRKRGRLLLLTVGCLGLSLGWWRGDSVFREVRALENYTGQKVTVEGVATSDGVYSDKSQLEFDLSDIKIEGQPIRGTFQIAGFGELMVYRGDTVQASGKLYRVRGSRQARISYAQLKVTGHSNDLINSLRQRFAAGMYTALPEPQASFGLGLLIGQRSTLPEIVAAQLSAVGLTHIIAVSGYNVTILVRAVRRLSFINSKYQITILSLLLIAGFIVITGFSASIVRAGLVSLFSVWAWYYGRFIRPIVLILFVAAMTGAWNPLYVWSDIGWYLSFLAFFGVLIIAPLVSSRLFKTSQPKLFTGVLMETSAAQLATLPLIMYIFGKVAPLSIIANLLVVPVVPLAMLFSAIAALAGALVPHLSGWLAVPAQIVLGEYMLALVSSLASLQNSLSIKVDLVGMIIMYGLMVVMIIILRQRLRSKSGIITDKKTLKET